MNRWTPSDQERLMQCRAHVFDALVGAGRSRDQRDDWEEHERLAVTLAANEWAQAHGYPTRLTVADVERIERPAIGHSDYGAKLALYVAENVLGVARV